MYYTKKTIEISASHSLKLNYESKCRHLHGHNWIITIYCKAEELDENGMVVDFSDLKQQVELMLDHKNLNEVFDFNPTAENLARWIVDNVHNCYKAEVQESQENTAIYERN
ncbi:MAG: 6-carboxytetrahydropterin synthase QueD [Prevotellaceae bacterium]|jgi:6-pyruvoyltetrahydropterin/6-carboxytetrahydropterin synthase|nr:6-carboxytetrahydropterin synthase QueD [Prevotellaceae bacterium]